MIHPSDDCLSVSMLFCICPYLNKLKKQQQLTIIIISASGQGNISRFNKINVLWIKVIKSNAIQKHEGLV